MVRLEVKDVTQQFGNADILEGISLVVEPGQIACLLGPSGCGKTTLFNVIAGLTRPVAGAVLLGDRDITGQSGHLSYMLQKDLLLPHKRVIDNVALPLVLRGMTRDEARAQVTPLFEVFGLAGAEDRWPGELSGGMRQRAALLRAYLFSRDFMLLDEPFSALDAFTKADMHAWFLEVAERFGTTALVITHDIDEAIALADVVYVMDGAPQRGRPTHVVGEERIACPRAQREAFALTPEFLEHKRRVMELLR